MVDRRKNFGGKSLEEVADMMADSDPASNLVHAAHAEFLLRQTQFHERAAKAAEETAIQPDGTLYTCYAL
jgi:hypothetical protein